MEGHTGVSKCVCKNVGNLEAKEKKYVGDYKYVAVYKLSEFSGSDYKHII
jgi:hypothetical protein